jgi:dihydrofolate reductase
MRRILMFNRVSVDGLFAGPNGEMSFIVPDDAVDRAGATGIPSTDTVMLGRKTYEMFESFWPKALEAPDLPNPNHPGRKSPEQNSFAVALNAMTKLVFSKTLRQVSWKNSQLIHEFDPRRIEALKREPGRDIIVLGSGSIVAQLSQHGLIDEYSFVISPYLLGSGKSLFSGVTAGTRLELAEARTYRSGNVLLRYVRGSE